MMKKKYGKKIYREQDKNAFYRLKNRLLEDISKSMMLQYFDSTDYHPILNNIILSRLFQGKGQAKIAFYYLGKAEKKANEIESFELLELVYTEFIKLSHETLKINPEEYISKRKENRKKLVQIQEIDDILAAVIYRIKTSQNFSKQNYEIIELLQKTLQDFSANPDIHKSSQLRFKIYHAVSRILLQQQDYQSLEKYLLKAYREFSKENLFNKNNHDTKLQMLTYLINSLFKNKKFDLSLKYAEQLKNAMKEYNNYLYDKYLFYYYNSLFINYSQKDIDKSIEILNEAKENAVIKALPFYIVFIYLNLSLAYFGKKYFKESLRHLVKLMMEEGFKSLDIALQFKINILELLIRFELQDFDYLEHKSKQIKKEFSNLLNSDDYWREREMMEVLSLMMYVPIINNDKKLLNKIKKFLDSKSNEENDIVKYNTWLKEKIQSGTEKRIRASD